MRLTPRRLRSQGRMPVVSRPSTKTRPAVGRYWPSTQLNSVDFPRAVRADDAEDFALVHREGDAVDRGDAAEGLAQSLHLEDGAHGSAVSVPEAGSGAGGAQPRQRRRGTLGEPDQAGRTDRHQHHHEERIDEQVIALGEAQPFRREDGDEPAGERPEEIAGAADDHHQQQVERKPERERVRLDELHERRVDGAGAAAEARADRERHQRVAAGVDARAKARASGSRAARRRRGPRASG